MPLETISNKDNTVCCVFCKSPTIDEINLGPIYARDGTACHYYCMLFSAALKQKGRDEEGILGFLAEDMYKEMRRAGRLRCAFCRTYGASVGCCRKKCAKAFHFTCGLKNGVNFQFFGQYEAFCSSHSKPQVILVKYKDWKCPICMSRVTHADDPVMANCCNGAVFHKECLKKMALNAGYFFKCPMCNSMKIFVDEMRSLGIFVPEQDASWEREPNAFQELLFEYAKCDAVICGCSKGREYNASKGGFILARCRICGAAGVHRQCGKLKTADNWACDPCLDVEIKTKEERLKTQREKLKEIKRRPEFFVPYPSPNLKSQQQQIGKPFSATSHFRAPKMLQEDVSTDLRKVKISNSCFNYFPYTQDKMAGFQESGSVIVPDWRGLTVQVNLVDWLEIHIRNSQGPMHPSLGMRALKHKVPVNSLEPKKNPMLKKTYVPSSVNIIPKKRKPKHFKASRWRRGVISKKKPVHKKPPIPIVNDEVETNTSISSNFVACSRMSTEPIAENVSQNKHVLEEYSPIVTQENAEESSKQKFQESKKRKVVELGYRMFAIGLNRELFVQSNVEVGEEVCMEEENLVIDWTALHSLGSFVDNVGDENMHHNVDMNCNGFITEIPEPEDSPLKKVKLTGDSEDGTLKQESQFRDIRMEHSYCKSAGENSNTDNHDPASFVGSKTPEEPETKNVRNSPKKSMECRENMESSNISNGDTLAKGTYNLYSPIDPVQNVCH